MGHTRTIWGRMWENIGQYGKKLEKKIWETYGKHVGKQVGEHMEISSM